MSIRSSVLLFVVLAGCKNNKESAPAPEPAKPEAAKPEAAKPAPPPAPPPDLKVKVTQKGNDAGTFDGARALFLKDGKERSILIPANCEKYTCEAIGDGMGTPQLQKDCPGVSFLSIKLNGPGQEGEPKAGATKVDLYLGHLTGGQGLTGGWSDGAVLSEVAADHIAGKIDFKDADGEVHGAFNAKACPAK